jgi:glycosyltransferase involved in cell wall biosynthesis
LRYSKKSNNVPEKLSVIIPCYNEKEFIGTIIKKVVSVSLIQNLEKEIIVVNDGSTDGTADVLDKIVSRFPGVRVLHHPSNSGKGASIKTALEQTTGDIVIIQDADLEYDPNEYNRMLQPILDGFADVVYGSRFTGNGPRRVLFFFHTIGNKLLTFISNLFTGLNLTDMETGYKMFKTGILRQVELKEKRFGFEPEITAKISKIRKIRIFEVGIAYYGRTYSDGKKVKWVDGFRAIWCVLKYNILSR